MLNVIINNRMISAFDDGISSVTDSNGLPMYFFQNMSTFLTACKEDLQQDFFVTKDINNALKNTYIFLRGLLKTK